MKAYFSKCPRCTSKSLENLSTFSHCVNCLYTADRYVDRDAGFFQAVKIERELEPFESEENKITEPAQEVA